VEHHSAVTPRDMVLGGADEIREARRIKDEYVAMTENGWAWPPLAVKFHYFVDNMSLCRKWAYSGERDPIQEMGEQPTEVDCKVCWKLAKKLEAEGADAMSVHKAIEDLAEALRSR
jgi:hypothetical protein